LEFLNKINKILIDSPNETSKKAYTMIQVLVCSKSSPCYQDKYYYKDV
jgi:hypothetical protein